ncbi:hypothetical protein AB4441_02220 [Vibrio splendidus]
MAQSPELAGGDGFTFEGDAAAFYLSALLAQAYAPGIHDRTVVGVSVQQRDFGEPLDDVIVDFEDRNQNLARLSLQVKRSLTISSAKSNSDFRDIVRDSWATLNKSEFRNNTDRYGAAVGTISRDKERELKKLCDWARESTSAEHFDARFAENGAASNELKAVKGDITNLLQETKGEAITSKELHQFLSHFVLITFDFLSEGATSPSEAINRIRDCLSPNDVDKAPLVWSKLVQLARFSAGKAGQINRTRLVRHISTIAKLSGAVSFCQDIAKLKELAKSYANAIPDDIGGEKLERADVLDELGKKLSSAQVVQIRGLPGSGKSVIVKRAVQQAMEEGSVLFLKAEQIEGTSWNSYAVAQGLSGTPLELLLVEIGATGTPTLFIDAIDRIDKDKQAIVLDLFEVIVASPLLDNWRIVVSLRDSGIELLNNWLGTFLAHLKVETLNLDQLNDEEAEILAQAKPHLRPLLFGANQIREIVRRPFFAKVLNQGHSIDPSTQTFTPRSEVDLIENWWRHGGYNESGQNALERQQVLLELATAQARKLNQPVRIRQLASAAQINALRTDGILQNAREGISVRFSHDIFFEWAFFYVLADCDSYWLQEIKTCGEPPAVARAVELVSQWEYVQGEDWSKYLSHTEGSDLRTQWLRAWLVGPLGVSEFEADQQQFEKAIFADDFRLFRKLLVWFQAEKTTPNLNILSGSMSQEQCQRFAYLLGWPSDYAAWRRLIDFILSRVPYIPQRLYPEVVSIFEVWQSALAGLRNPTSHALLQRCAVWLREISTVDILEKPSEKSEYWNKVPSLGDFQTSLRQLILRASIAEPSFAANHIKKLISSERVSDEVFHDILGYSSILAQSLPQSLLELSSKVLLKELPEEIVAREEQQRLRSEERRQLILGKPEKLRTKSEQMELDWCGPIGFSSFSHFDWTRLSIHDDLRSFNPPSPLQEPFHSLFLSAPIEALQLLRALCNHAMAAWRQLHNYSYERRGTPIPLEIDFSWGKQIFWGSDQEYLWCRGMWAPDAIGCGFMALEEWCFSELERNRPVDELIQQIVEGNDCIAILGIASMLTLHAETVSEMTLPLFTSQRLLTADNNRMVQELSSIGNLMGFSSPADKTHIESIKVANERAVRRQELKRMIPIALFSSETYVEEVRKSVANFVTSLPFQYEEQRSLPNVHEELMAQAIQYAELIDINNYQAYKTNAESNELSIVYTSPSASEPENVAKAEIASRHLALSNLWAWASNYFESEVLSSTYTIESAITLAKQSDSSDLFTRLDNEAEDFSLNMTRGAVAATAAIVLNVRKSVSQEELGWARGVLKRAIYLPEKFDAMWSPSSCNSWHPAIFVVRGITADLREGTAESDFKAMLLGLIAHPAEAVSLIALEELLKLWSMDSKLAWAGLIEALSLCYFPPRNPDEYSHYTRVLHSPDETQLAINNALEYYEHGEGWPPLPFPRVAWVQVKLESEHRCQLHYDEYRFSDITEATEVWAEPEGFWHSKLASKILKLIPLAELMGSGARIELIEFLSSALDWTNQKNDPPWKKSGHRNHTAIEIYEWTNTLGSRLGYVAGLIPIEDVKTSFLPSILELDDENCFALLSPLVSTYICVHIYDSSVVPLDAISLLDFCLERVLESPAFNRNSYRGGELSGFHLPAIVRNFMFISVEQADLAARYVNGDWSEISRILPLVDRFVRTCGWTYSVMDPFLTLCERAKLHYPAEVFADQVISVINGGPDNLKGWHRSFATSRIADLVQYFSHRDAPLPLVLAQKFLRILDMLVDMGDRRSAALQLGETFRSIKLTEKHDKEES